MSIQTHILAQELLAKNSLEECTLQDVKDLVASYPYYAPAQFLLLEKLKEINDPEYTEQLQKSILYYHDPLVFEYFIAPGKFYTEYSSEENEEHVQVEQPEIETIQGQVIQEVAEPSAEQVNTVALNDEVLAFEPFHTVDYFASQGIKLSQEDVPKDKFGKQLKSFTEWLKTMKRLPAKEIQQMDPVSENNVQHLAEDSVHDPAVITESMAEVWLKQGNKQKALEVYNKLSLLNPSKLAYFAGKIENLKNL